MQSFRFSWKYILSITVEHKRELIFANWVAILATIASVPLPLLMPLLVDEVLLEKPGVLIETLSPLFPEQWHGPVFYIVSILIITVILRAIALVLNVWQARQFTIISKDIIFRMRKMMLLRLGKISMAEYETLGSGAVSSHFVTDLDTVDRFIGSSVSRLLIASLSIIGTAIILLWMHWALALFIMFLNPVVIYFTTVIGKRVKELKKHENKSYEVFQGALTETLDAIQQIRASNREQHYLSRLVDDAREVRDNSSAYEWKSEAAGRFSFLVFLIGFDLFRAVSMLMVVFSDLSIGQMMAVFGYLWFMMGPVQEVLGIQYAYYGAKAALARLNRILELQQEPQYPALSNPFESSRSVSIEIDDVYFSYNDGTEILKGLSLQIKKGQKIALVGASGGGKSTFVQVLLGLYIPQAGKVRFNGVPVEQIGLDVVRDNVATVLQHPALFNGTIHSNLCMGKDFSEESIWKALKIAQLDKFIRALDKGLYALVGRQGVRLSGGQRQRLAVARMVLADPQVVILDEATSALDTETERALHDALQNFLKDRTTLIVAHRLSAVKQADHVYVFEDGKVAEEGGHHQLIEQDGLYARLYGQH
ncbi:ABC transporter ATP-binding protein [Neptunomonas japonica]|uniref:ABC transporter ATP-binding protein n=1 Tax=Neptunomonas japonica TaxID=417574 RepID=UPI0004138BBC|nr:ABC transporter ATP-binding protein [Neptunomonas japonica]